MILYFSGTGNSRYAAELISSVTGDRLVSLNDVIKHKKEPVFESEKPFVIVCPTYAWRIPRVVEKLILEADFRGNNEMYFYLTCGNSAGNAYGYAKKLCEKKGLVFKGLGAAVMPENYVAMFSVPDKEEADRIIDHARPEILSAAKRISEGKELVCLSKPLGKILSKVVNGPFYSLVVNSKGFYSTDKCIGCGKCEKVCPLSNIKITDGRPVWGNDCTHCMACICLCPTEAVEYKNKSQGKPRYHI